MLLIKSGKLFVRNISNKKRHSCGSQETFAAARDNHLSLNVLCPRENGWFPLLLHIFSVEFVSCCIQLKCPSCGKGSRESARVSVDFTKRQLVTVARNSQIATTAFQETCSKK